MRTFFLYFLFFLIPLYYASAFDWGKTGHRATGQIAVQYLTPKAKRGIDKILEGHSLAFVSTYGDEIRSDEGYKSYGPWHYVNFPFGKKYGEEPPSEFGDLVSGIQKCIDILKDSSSTAEEQKLYLKLLVHFIGDLHQPLHVGKADDKGGNLIQVRWFENGTNLHKVWDSDMIDFYGMSYTELAENTDELSQEELARIKKGSVLDWVYESQDLAKIVYASANTGEKLGYKYMYDHFTTVRNQLQKGGIRLATILNGIFDN